MQKQNLIIFIVVLLIPAYGYSLTGQFISSIGSDTEYTDNLNLTSDNEESEIITYIAPAFSLNLNSVSTQTSMIYRGSYSYYKEHDENNTLGHSGLFNYTQRPSRNSTITLSNSYTETEDLRTAEGSEIRSSRQKYITNNANIGYTVQFGQNNRFGSNFQYNTLENEDEALNDNENYVGSLSLNYEIMPHLTSSASVSVTHAAFQVKPPVVKSDDYNSTEFSGRIEKAFNRVTSAFFQYDHIYMHYLDSEGNDYMIFDPSVGFSFSWSETSHLSVGLGYIYEKNETMPDDSSLHATIDLNKTWQFQNGDFNATVSNGYEQSYLDAVDSGINYYYEANGTLNYRITRNLGYTGALNYRYDIYENPGVSTADRKDNNVSFTSGLNWMINNAVTTSLDYGFNLRDSEDSSYDYKENRIELTLNLIYWDKRF